MKPKDWRLAQDLTLEQLSEKMGYSNTGYLSEVENGVKSPSGRMMTQYHKLSKGAVGPADFVVHASMDTPRRSSAKA